MTQHLLDVSRWQISTTEGGMRAGPSLDLAAAKAAGFTLVNVQLSGKDGYRPGPWALRYADRARELGMGVCAYWWLDGSRPGAAQARDALAGMQAVGASALQIDSESDATERIWRDCVTAAQDGLGRHVAAYTGRWWWLPRGWTGADLTPHLWAMHETSGAYPGDDSPDWDAAYGGWTGLSLLQYGVAPVGGVDATLSAIRDPRVWAELTGEPMAWFLNRALTNFRTAVTAAFPNRDKTSDGTIGDAAHASRSSDHNPDPDGSVDAWDMDVDLRAANNVAEIEDLKQVFEGHQSSSYWIHNDVICRRADNWLRRSYPDYLRSRGVDPSSRNRHDKHVHWNSRETHENSTAPWPIQGDDMPLEDTDVDKIWAKRFGEYVDENGNQVRDMRTVADVLYATHRGVLEARLRDEAMLAAVVDDADRAAILARIDEKAAAITAEVNEVSGEVVTQLGAADLTVAEKADLLRPVLGDDAAAVGALLAQV